MDGGAWQSETFDNGRDYQKPRAMQAQSVETGTPPAMYNPSPVPMSKDTSAFGIIVLTLRSTLIVLTLIAFSVMASNKQTISSYYYPTSGGIYASSTVKFTALKAYVGLLSFDVIVCFYATVQLVHSIVQFAMKGTFISLPTTGLSMLTFLFDTILAHGLIAAAGAAADSAAIVGDSGDCSNLSKFCAKADVSIAVSFIAFAVLAITAILYPVRLLKASKL